MAEKRNKLEVTVLPQGFTPEQQNQARTNISAAAIANTVSEIKSSDGTVSATTGRNPDGSLYYNLKVSATPIISDTEIHGNNGISAKKEPNSTTWNIGLSADYLSANALTNLSGNWQNTYSAVSSNSASWNEASAFAANSGEFAIKTDIDNKFDNTSAWAKQTFASASQLADYYKKTETSANGELDAAFDKKQDKLTTDQLSAISSVPSIKSDLATHVEDIDVHIQEGERDKWNEVDNKVDNTAFNEYKDEVNQEFTNTSAWANETFQPIGNYLSANALNNLSGHWDSVYNSVLANSASWNETSAVVNENSGFWGQAYTALTSTSATWNNHSALSSTKLDVDTFNTWEATEFEPVKTDVDTLKSNSAHYPVESTNEYITVNSADHKFTLTFVSGDLATKAWVNEQLGDFGGYVPCEGTGADNHPNIVNPDPKKMYLVPKQDATDPDRYYNWIVTGVETTGWLCIGDTSMDLTPYLKISDISGVSGNWNTAYSYVTANSANIAEASATAINVNNTVNTYSSNWQESYNALTGTSAKWNKVYDTVNANSATWNDTNTTLSDNSGKWEESYEALTSTSADWNKTYTYITANSANIESVSATVNANSGKWNEASAFSANSGKFVTSGNEIADDKAYVLTNNGTNVAWSGIDLSDLGKMYPINSLTPDLVSATISAVNGTSAYILSAKEPEEYEEYDISASMMSAWTGVYDDTNYFLFKASDISGYSGISAKYITTANKWDIGLTDDEINTINSKLDTTAFSTVSGDFATKRELQDELEDTSAWANATFQPIGDYLSASNNYLSANALDNLSGNWNDAYDTLTVNSAVWNEVSSFNNTVITSTDESVGITATTVDNTVTYDLSVPPAEITDISGRNGISAYYDENEEKYIVEMEKSNLVTYGKFHTTNNTYVTSAEITGFAQDDYIGTDIYLDNAEVYANSGLYHVDMQVEVTIPGNDNTYYNTILKATTAPVRQIQQEIDGSYAHTETISLSYDIRIAVDATKLAYTIENLPTNATFFVKDLNVHRIICSLSEIGGSTYQAGNGLLLQNDTFSFDIGDGLEFSGNQVQVKLGDGLKFDENAGVGVKAITINNQVEEVVETVTTIASDLDTKISNNFPPAMITVADADIAAYRNNGCLYGTLFSVNINSEVEIDRSLIGMYIYRVDNDMDVMFGLYEYQPDYPRYNNDDPTQGISGYGRTVPLCDTGIVQLTAATKGFCEFPIKNLNKTIGTQNPETRPSLKSSCMYYATIYLGSNVNAGGLHIGSFSGYTPPFNDIKPGLTIFNDNINCSLTASYSADVSFNDFGFSWKYNNYTNYYNGTDNTYVTGDYGEKNDGYRFYMQIRNKAQSEGA